MKYLKIFFQIITFPLFPFFKSLGMIRFLCIAMAAQHILQHQDTGFSWQGKATQASKLSSIPEDKELSHFFWASLCYITVSRKDPDQLLGGHLVSSDSSPLKHVATLTDQNLCIFQGQDSFPHCQLLDGPTLWRLKVYPLPW